MKNLHNLAFWLVIIGGLNWFLVGIFGWDIGMIFGGQGAFVSRVFYILIGISAFYLFYLHKDCCLKGEICHGKKESSKSEVSTKDEVKPEVEVKSEAKADTISPDSIVENNPEGIR